MVLGNRFSLTALTRKAREHTQTRYYRSLWSSLSLKSLFARRHAQEPRRKGEARTRANAASHIDLAAAPTLGLAPP